MMWSEKDVEAASNVAISDMLEQEANGAEYVDIRVAMRAAFNAVSGWWPIETALKDGRQCLVAPTAP